MAYAIQCHKRIWRFNHFYIKFIVLFHFIWKESRFTNATLYMYGTGMHGHDLGLPRPTSSNKQENWMHHVANIVDTFDETMSSKCSFRSTFIENFVILKSVLCPNAHFQRYMYSRNDMPTLTQVSRLSLLLMLFLYFVSMRAMPRSPISSINANAV